MCEVPDVLRWLLATTAASKLMSGVMLEVWLNPMMNRWGYLWQKRISSGLSGIISAPSSSGAIYLAIYPSSVSAQCWLIHVSVTREGKRAKKTQPYCLIILGKGCSECTTNVMLMKTLSRSISPSIINETFQTVRTAGWWSVLCWGQVFLKPVSQ